MSKEYSSRDFLRTGFKMPEAHDTFQMRQALEAAVREIPLVRACRDRVMYKETFPTEDKFFIHIAYEALRHIERLEAQLLENHMYGLPPILMVSSKEEMEKLQRELDEKRKG